MELATIFLIWLMVTVVDNLAKRKKRRLPPPETPPDFEIPPLANSPSVEVPIFIEPPKSTDLRPIKKSSAQMKSNAQAEETNELNLNLTPATVMEAFVLSEILSKPKAARRPFFSRI